MKFFAILRDSVREALDAKVIYFVFGLTALFLVGLGSLSFQPEPAEKGLDAIVQRFPGGQAMGQRPPLTYEVEHLQQTNEPAPAWKGEYRYDLVVRENAPEPPPREAEDGPAPPPPPQAPRGQFRAIVLMTNLMTKTEDEMTPQERADRKRLRNLLFAAARAGGKPGPEVQKAAAELAGEIKAVPAAQLEGFLKKQLAASGALEVTNVKLTDEKPGEYRFQVGCQARPETVRTWPHSLVVLYGALTIPAKLGVGPVVYTLQDVLVAGVGAGVAMLLSTVITAFFIPNMLRKGTIDLLLSKPLHRWGLLLSKYVGGLTFMFVITFVAVAGAWLVLGLRSGLWGTGFLLSIPVLTAQFAIFYAFSTLLAVLTRSPIVCILGVVAVWALLFAVNVTYTILKPMHEFEMVPDWAYTTSAVAQRSLPRYKDLDVLNSELIARDLLASEDRDRVKVRRDLNAVNWYESAGVTLGYIALLLGLSCWRFSVKDY
jgi:ABC-type transport system involved in multi-copper enzyme maturation permease subunit